VRADAPEDTGQGQLLHDDVQGLLILALFHHMGVALHILTGRAGHATRGLVRLLHRKGTWYGLGVLLVNRGPITKGLVILTGQGNRAGLDTLPAGSTLVEINVPGFLFYGNLEVAFGTFYLVNFCTCDQVDIQMPADLDQFGGNNSHGTVIGGKRFIQLTHHSADSG